MSPYLAFDFVKKLEESIVGLREHHPPGFIDFRQGIPTDFRSGLFMRAGNAAGREVNLESMFGSAKIAVEVAAEVSAAIECTVAVVPPHTETVECEGEASRVKCGFWTIYFSVIAHSDAKGWAYMQGSRK